jgi:hypothetical protein
VNPKDDRTTIFGIPYEPPERDEAVVQYQRRSMHKLHIAEWHGAEFERLEGELTTSDFFDTERSTNLDSDVYGHIQNAPPAAVYPARDLWVRVPSQAELQRMEHPRVRDRHRRVVGRGVHGEVHVDGQQETHRLHRVRHGEMQHRFVGLVGMVLAEQHDDWPSSIAPWPRSCWPKRASR